MYPGFQAVALEDLGDLCLGGLFQQHEGLCTQRGNGNLVTAFQRVSLRQNGQKPVLPQRDGIEFRPGRQPQEAAVHPALGDPLLNFRVVPQQQLIVHPGIVLLEGLDDVGHPVNGAAGEGADADHAGLHAVEVVHLHLELPVFCADALGIGQQPGAVGGQADAAAVPLQKGDAPLPLQVADHPADAGLGIVQQFGGFCKAACLHGLQKGHVFQDIHLHGIILLSFDFVMDSMRNIRFSNA